MSKKIENKKEFHNKGFINLILEIDLGITQENPIVVKESVFNKILESLKRIMKHTEVYDYDISSIEIKKQEI